MADLKNIGYSDGVLHEVIEKDGQKTEERNFFPFTRYQNIINRPKLVKPNEYIKNSNNPEFLLVATSEEEVEDNEIYKFFNQDW